MIHMMFDAPHMVDADQIRQHEDNINNGDIEAIIESLRTNGCYRPIYVSSSSSRILAGHHLYQALLALGETQVPIQWVDNLDAEEERRILYADNKLASLAMLDKGLELAMLKDLQNTDKGLMGLGVDDEYVSLLEEDQATGFSGGEPEGMEGIDQEVECPHCGHTFTRTITP